MRKIVEVISEPVYRFELVFLAGLSHAQANKELEIFNIKPIEEQYNDARGLMFGVDEKEQPKATIGKCYIVWLRNRYDFYTLVHEVAHLVIEVFADKNIEVNNETTEVFAWYQEFWIKKLWDLMRI